MALPQVGVEAVVANLSGFKAGADAIGKAYDNITVKAGQATKASEEMGLRFSEASGRWHAASGRFASTAELAAAGVQNVKKSVDVAGKSADTSSRSFVNLGGVLNGIKASAASIAPHFVSIGQSVLNFGAIAGGAALVGIGALTAGIVGLGTVAVGEFAKYERMSLSIQNLVAREISQGQVVEKQTQSRISLTAKETEELSKIPQKIQDEELSRKTLAAQIQEQKQRIIELTASYGENGLNVQTAKARLAEMENEYSKSSSAIDTLNGRMSELNNKNGQLTTTLQKVRVGQISMTDAMAQADPKAQELLKWIQLLAIQSPFSQEDVALSFQTAMAYGFTTDQAKRLTTASLDFAAATGKGGEVTGQIALALGQMQAKGKVSGQELIQLTNAGVGVNKILEDMGFTLDDVSKGLVSSDAFINAVMKDMEVFKGAGKAQSSTFAGLFASLSDLKSIGLREFFGGTFKAIQPYLAQFVDFLTKAAFETGSIKALGDTLGTYVGEGLKTVLGLVAQFQRWGPEGIFAAMGFKSSSLFFAQLSALWAMITEQGPSAESIFTSIGSAVDYLQANTFPTLTKAISFVMQNFDSFKGALLGIGAVLGAGVFAAIVAGLLSLVTPISLIVAGAALLGAAWVGNWGGIQEKTFAVWAVLQPILQQTYDWLAVNIPIAVQIMTDFWNSTLFPVFDMLQQRASLVIFTFEKFGASQGFAMLGNQVVAVVNMMIPGFSNIVTWLQINIPLAIQMVSNFWTGTLIPAYQMVSDFVTQTLIPGFVNISTWLTNIGLGIQSVASFWVNTFLVAATSVWSFLSTVLFPLLQAIASFQQAVWNKTIEASAGLWQNVLYPALLIVGGYISQQLSPIITQLVLGWNTVKTTLTIVGNYLSSTLTPALKTTGTFSENIGKIISEKVIPVIEALANVSLALLSKALDGVIRAIKEATGFFKTMADAVNNFKLPEVLQEHSPSPFAMSLIHIAQAADQAGLSMESLSNITQKGTFDKLFKIDRSVTDFNKILQESRRGLEKWGKDRQIGPEKVNFAINRFRDIFKTDFSKIMGSDNPLATFQDMLTKQVEWRKIGLKPEDARHLGKMFFDNFFKESEKRAQALTDMIISGSQQAIQIAGQLNQFASQQVDYLNSQVETLQNLVASGDAEVNFEGNTISAAQAQELLNQKLEDQKNIQDDILQIKQQESKLQFLESQLNLIKMVRDAGLNVKDVLGNIKLGLNASIPDMLAATNNVIQAIVGQVDSDLTDITQVGKAIGESLSTGVTDELGISSPSKVMQWIAKQTTSGFVNEMLSQAPKLVSAIENTIVVPAGQLMSGIGSTSNVVNNNFNMDVSTLASPQAVMQQYQVMRAMV